MRVAAVQLCCGSAVRENLEIVRELVSAAADAGAELIVLPENFAFLGSETDKLQWVESVPDPEAPIQSVLVELARRHQVHLVAGGMPERSADPSRPHNTALLVGPDGQVAGRYRKIHLFDVDLSDGETRFTESSNTSPGSEVVTARVGGFSLGFSICYDIRFPELYRRLVAEGVDVLLAPAAFTRRTGEAHWHTLLRARAIESQSYVIAAAQWGRHPCGRMSYGHTLIVDPWGEVVAERPEEVGFVVADLSHERVDDVRRRLPSLAHRRM